MTPESLLADFLSNDSQRIWSASWVVIKTRDEPTLSFLEPHITAIEKAVSDIELGGAIRPNRDSFEFAMRKLRFNASRAGCLCELYPENLGFDPEKEATAGNVVIESKKEIPWADEYVCLCPLCHRKYAIQSGEHHFTWWKWSLLES